MHQEGYDDQYNIKYNTRQNRNSGAQYQERLGYGEEEEPNGCIICVKYLLIIFNVIFLLAGIGVCTGSIYILVDKLFISDIIENELLTVACWLIIVASGLSIIVAICGTCGAATNHRCLLFVYAGLLITVATALIGGGVVALALRPDFGEWVMTSMEETLKNDYGVNQHDKYHQVLTQAWDKAQIHMHCCAVRDNSWPIYRQSKWYAEQPGIETVDKPYVPKSCCKLNQYKEFLQLKMCQTFYLGPPALQHGPDNTALHYLGCYTRGEEWIEYYSGWLAGLGLAFGFCLVVGVVLAFCMAICGRKRSK